MGHPRQGDPAWSPSGAVTFVLASLDPTIGAEIKKTRLVIVVSNDTINRLSQLAVVTKNTAHLSPSHTVVPRGMAGLTFDSKAVTEQIKAGARASPPAFPGHPACRRSHGVS